MSDNANDLTDGCAVLGWLRGEDDDSATETTYHYAYWGGTFAFLICNNCGNVLLKDWHSNYRRMKPPRFCDNCGMDAALWEAGYARSCIRAPRSACGFEPCCIVQGVRCCAECPFVRGGCACPRTGLRESTPRGEDTRAHGGGA